MTEKKLCLQICTSCDAGLSGNTECDGKVLYDALASTCTENSEISVEAVDCFAVCERSVTIAFRPDISAKDQWSYMIGDVCLADTDDILSTAQAIIASPHGIPMMKDRPDFFRKGTICRLPPAR